MSSQSVQPGSWWRHLASGTVEQMVFTEYLPGQPPMIGLRDPEADRSRVLSVDELLSDAYEPA